MIPEYGIMKEFLARFVTLLKPKAPLSPLENYPKLLCDGKTISRLQFNEPYCKWSFVAKLCTEPLPPFME